MERKRYVAALVALALTGMTQCGAIGGGAVGAPIGGTTTGACAPAGTLCPSSGICNIAVLGDSTSAWPDGEGTPHDGISWVAELQGHLGRCYAIFNYAVAASRVDDAGNNMTTIWNSTVEGNGFDVLITLGGINDIIADQGGAATATAMKVIHAEAAVDTSGRAGGIKVLSLEVMPFGLNANHTAARQTELDALNSALATPDNANVTADVGLYAELEDDSNPDECPVAWCYDGLHLTNNGTTKPGDGTANVRDYILAAGYFSE